MVRYLLDGRTTIVWLILVVATVVSWQVGTHGGSAGLSTTVVMAVAFVKVRLIGLWFMDLKDAPVPLRALFEAYVATVGLAVIVMYAVL